MNMKRKHATFLYVLLTLFFVSGCGTHVQNLDSKGSNIICFGDSITYGTGAPKGNDYPTFLGIFLGKNVINTGVPGDTTYGALERLESDVLERDPYIVVVEIGGNDYLQKIPKEHTLKNLERIISRIQNNGAIVVLCDISGGIGFPKYRRSYRNLAKKTGSIFIPGILETVLRNPSLKSDHIHPNSEGYKLIAKMVYEAIRKYVYR